MIRINLVVSQRARYLRAQRARRNELYVVIALILLGGIIGGVWGMHLEGQRVILESQKRQRLEALAYLQTELVELQNRTDRKKKLEETIRAYQAMTVNHMVPTMVLDIVSKELTPFSLWLTHIQLDNREILLEGEGLDKTDIPRFIKSMQETHEFQHIRLVEIQGRLGERIPQFHFAVTMQILPDQVYDRTI